METEYETQCLNNELSPSNTPSSPSPDQNASPRALTGMVHEQSLYIAVEPQRDGMSNAIHLINSVTGEILFSGIYDHGSHIEIQPGVIFRVPFPHEHQSYNHVSPPMQHMHPPSAMYRNPYPVNLAPSGHTLNNSSQMIISTHYHADMINPTCPLHGSPQGNAQYNNDRLDKTKQKQQKKFREKNNGLGHCTCTYKQQHYQYESYDSGYTVSKKMQPMSNDTLTQSDQNGAHQMELEKDLTIHVPPRTNAESLYAINITWEESISNNAHLYDCAFELQMSNKANNNYRTIFTGSANAFQMSDLQPGTEYFFRLCAIWDNRHGPHSDVVSCVTRATVPGRPHAPRVSQKSKMSLTLKWNAPTQDGGCPVSSYRLQWKKENEDMPFTDLYVGLLKQHRHNHKLPPGTPCLFRLQASNKFGDSEFSNVLQCLTSAGPPSVPDKPEIVECGTNYIRLKWREPGNNGSPIEQYKLEMEDPNDGYGFMVKYSGEGTSFCCQNLKRNTTYKFRLSASNQQGFSRPSQQVLYGTLPEAPGKMDMPKVNGKPRTTAICLKWEPPKDSGGEQIIGYILQIDDGKGGAFKDVYRGCDHEYMIEQLRPGKTYYVRVASESRAGVGTWSSKLGVTTLPVAPRDCQPPRLSKAEPNCLHLEWDAPKDNGGATINSFTVSMATSPQNEFKEIYSGNKRGCSVPSLSPGLDYYFKLQATNQAGTSQWSSISTLCTAPSVPDAPSTPVVLFKSPTQIRIEWVEPVLHGAEVTSYCVEKLENETFQKVYQGPCMYCEIKRNILPASHYYFRLQAISTAGASPYSDVFTVETPSSSPAAVCDIKVIEQTSNSCLIQWKHPIEHGSPVHEYILEATGATSMICTVQRTQPNSGLECNTLNPNTNLDLNVSLDSKSDDRSSGIECDTDGESDESDCEGITESITESETSSSLLASKIPDDTMEFRLTDLTADASYKLRIQAVNGVGAGPFSNAIQFFTKQLPPCPPSLNASSVSYHSIKLKWGDASMKKSHNILTHNLQVQNKSGSFTTVYNGIGTSFTLGKLKELTPYCCRIRSKNDAGEGEYSKPNIFYTKAKPPSTIKDMKSSNTTPTSLKLHWSPIEKLRTDDVIKYTVQILSDNGKDFVKVYNGHDTNCYLTDLKPDEVYQFRIHAIRYLSEVAISSVPSTPSEIKGVFSQPLRVRSASEKTVEETEKDDGETGVEKEEPQQRSALSDMYLAEFLLFLLFVICCLFITVLLRWVSDMQLV